MEEINRILDAIEYYLHTLFSISCEKGEKKKISVNRHEIKINEILTDDDPIEHPGGREFTYRGVECEKKGGGKVPREERDAGWSAYKVDTK